MKVEKQSIYYEKLSIENKLDYSRVRRNQRLQRMAVLFSVFILMIISTANMLSTTFYRVISSGKDLLFSTEDSTKHIIWLFFGGSISLLTGMIVPHTWYKKKKIRIALISLSIVTLLGVLIGARFLPRLVPKINGAIGWIRLGPITIQPSEFIKIVYVITLAHILEVAYKNKLKTSGILFVVTVPILAFCSLVYKQGDLGTTIHYLMITACMLIFSPISKKLIVGTLTFVPIAFSTIISYFYFFPVDGGYRIQRITSYVNILFKGNENDRGVGYQVIQSLIAMGNGGILGRGYGNGIQKYNYLPEIHTDFISASLAEEWGFMMMLSVILIFLFILKIGMNTAILATDYFSKYLVVGLVSLIFTQALMNLYVATGLMPVTGLPLPIFSYGGSSTLTIFLALGIILNINKKTVKCKYSK